MKCLNQEGLKYLWSLIKGTFATQDELSRTIEKKVAKTDIIDNLDTDDAAKVLSASMGYEINQMFTQAFNDITTNGTAIAKKPDYEEGTWTPSLYTTKNSPTYYANEGIYKKVGNMVFCWGCLRLSNISSLEVFKVKGLPYAVLSAYGHGVSSEGSLSAAQTTLKDYNGASVGERDLGIYIDTNNRIGVNTPGDNQTSVYIGSNSNEQYVLYMDFWYMTNGTKL